MQNPQTNMALFLLTTLVPAIGYLLMLVPMHFYNITGDGHRQMMKEIMERRAQLKSEKRRRSRSVGICCRKRLIAFYAFGGGCTAPPAAFISGKTNG